MVTDVKKLILTGLIGVGGAAAPLIANANRAVPAMMGQPATAGDYPSFVSSNGKVFNTSSSLQYKTFCIGLPIENAGAKTVNVNAFESLASGGFALDCTAKAADGFGNIVGTNTKFIQFSQEGSNTTIALNVNVPNGGSLFVCCDIAGQSTESVDSVNYNN